MRKSNRPPEPGARGLLRLCCPCCGKEFGTYLHVAQMSIGCRCGATVDGSMIHGERVSTLYTPSNTSSGWIPRWKSENPPVRQIAPSSLSRWGMSRSRKSRGWKNELPVL